MSNNFQISNSKFLSYATQFGNTAEAGMKSAQAIYSALSPLSRTRFSSFTIKVDALNAANTMIYAVESSYEIMFSDANSPYPMESAFLGLSKHIRNWTGKTVNQYLTDEGITVNRIYANIVNSLATRGDLTGDTISSGNIET